MGWIYAGIVCLVLQVMSWMGSAKSPAYQMIQRQGAADFGFMIGSNISLIIGIILILIGLRKKAGKTENKQ